MIADDFVEDGAIAMIAASRCKKSMGQMIVFSGGLWAAADRISVRCTLTAPPSPWLGVFCLGAASSSFIPRLFLSSLWGTAPIAFCMLIL
ncbi:MAG: hypothetical protein RLZZ511_2947 [Cyanobacteriota bacterium]|jgi:hypothetical protein